MTTYLCNIVLTAGADKMARSDPHGWTLTLISICVVFIALMILYAAYSLIGWLNTGGVRHVRRMKAAADRSPEDDAVRAAIATALHLYLAEEAHDTGSGVITFKASPRPWADASVNFRKQPTK